MIGIYKITNKSNGKMYIGQSNDIQRRFYEHQTKGESSRIPLDIEIKELGKDAFTMKCLKNVKFHNSMKKRLTGKCIITLVKWATIKINADKLIYMEKIIQIVN